MGKHLMNKREVKRRIRQLVADEIRSRMDEHPGYLDKEPPEVVAAWTTTVWDIADLVFRESNEQTVKR